MRISRLLIGVSVTLFVCSCGSNGGSSSSGDTPPSCLDYCKALYTSQGGCGGAVADCASDCELWQRQNDTGGCTREFDSLVFCTEGTSNVCQAVGDQCSAQWHDWYSCVEKCNDPSDVIFNPACTATAPCKSGSTVMISSDVPLTCDVRVTVSCAGGTAIGYIPAGDPATTSGTLKLSCAQLSTGCGLIASSSVTQFSGSAEITCTP